MFISYDDNVLDRELAVIVILVYPLVQVIEALLARNIKDQYAAVSTSIIAGCQCSKAFLASSVPDLEPYSTGITSFAMLESSRAAIYANSCIIVLNLFAFTYAH